MDESIKRGALDRVSWSAIITGFFCTLAVQIALGLFGAALGVLGRTVGVGWGVAGALWGLGVAILAGFIGAYVAVRIARAGSTTGAELHGALVWCLGVIAALALLGMSVPGIAGTAGRPASAGGLALAGLSSIFGFGGALFGAVAGRRAVASVEIQQRGEFESREAREGYAGSEPRISRREEYYPTNPPSERH